MIWKNKPTLEYLNAIGQNTLSEHLGIEMTEIGDDYLRRKCQWIIEQFNPSEFYTVVHQWL